MAIMGTSRWFTRSCAFIVHNAQPHGIFYRIAVEYYPYCVLNLRSLDTSRIAEIRWQPGCYIITGGAIKLTRTMQEREHTLRELNKMEQVRNYLISNQAIDADGFVDFLSELL